VIGFALVVLALWTTLMIWGASNSGMTHSHP
jgi:hypothetical protein